VNQNGKLLGKHLREKSPMTFPQVFFNNTTTLLSALTLTSVT